MYIFLLDPHDNLCDVSTVIIVLILLMRKLRSDSPKRLLTEGATYMGLGSPEGLPGGSGE